MGASKTKHTLEEILAMLLTHEQQISSEAEAEAQAVPIYGAGIGGSVCCYCQKAGHIKAVCPKRLARMNIRCIGRSGYAVVDTDMFLNLIQF